MFDVAKYIKNSFSIIFKRQSDIRRHANDFEDRLKGRYFQPQIIPVPDDLDSEMPRMIFGSEHGYSQIIVSQVNLTLNVLFSHDWQVDIEKGKKYLKERVPILFELLDLLEDSRPHFCGLTTRVNLSTRADDLTIISHFSKKFLRSENNSNLHDVLFKTTGIVDNKFFNNTQVMNYRSWKSGQQEIAPLSKSKVAERGIQIVEDFNDRYAFNEQDGYVSNLDVANIIIEKGLAETEKIIQKVEGENS